MQSIYQINNPKDDPWSQIKDYEDAKYLEELIKIEKSKPSYGDKEKYEMLRKIACSECFREMRILLIRQLEDDE